jgi:hypothetical protein
MSFNETFDRFLFKGEKCNCSLLNRIGFERLKMLMLEIKVD